MDREAQHACGATKALTHALPQAVQQEAYYARALFTTEPLTTGAQPGAGLSSKGLATIKCAFWMWRTIMATRTDAYPDVAIPPREYLAEEIGVRGISQIELARRMGRPVNAINEIVNGKKAITAATALQLESAMPESPARFWLTLETDYQLTKALISRRASPG